MGLWLLGQGTPMSLSAVETLLRLALVAIGHRDDSAPNPLASASAQAALILEASRRRVPAYIAKSLPLHVLPSILGDELDSSAPRMTVDFAGGDAQCPSCHPQGKTFRCRVPNVEWHATLRARDGGQSHCRSHSDQTTEQDEVHAIACDSTGAKSRTRAGGANGEWPWKRQAS